MREPFRRLREDRPVILVNVALTRDGASTWTGSRQISCAEDWKRVHELRERVDAIAVGRRTWEVDRPRLDCREERLGRPPARQPARIVLAGSARIDPCPTVGSPLYVVGSCPPPDATAVWIEASGHALAAPLAELRARGIGTLLLEGGLTAIRAFLAQGCVDEVTAYIATNHVEIALAAIARGLPPLRWAPETRPFGAGMLVSFRAPSTRTPAGELAPRSSRRGACVVALKRRSAA